MDFDFVISVILAKLPIFSLFIHLLGIIIESEKNCLDGNYKTTPNNGICDAFAHIILSPKPVRSGLQARSWASGSIAKVVQEFPRNFAGSRKIVLKTLSLAPLKDALVMRR